MTEKHFVATGYVVAGGKTLLLFHKKLKMWLPPGGHIGPGEDPEEALLREIKEETGLDAEIAGEKPSPDPSGGIVRYLHRPWILQVENIPAVPGSSEKAHQHIDLIYFCRPKNGARNLRISKKEHEEMLWFGLEELKSEAIAEEVRLAARLAIAYFKGKAK